jgi:ferredoxin
MKQIETYQVKIYLSGNVELIKNVCREYCLGVGLCVTVTPTLFIYTGGEEYGVEIGLINYPRFPDTKDGVLRKATGLAERCRDGAFQWSYLIITPETTIYNSTRKEP